MKRIRLLFLMLLCVAGTALTARAQKVTLNFRNAKLEQVFGRITEQTGYTFYYARPTVNPDKVVSIAVADVDVRAALKQLLADDKVEIEIRDGKIYLSPPRQSAAVPQSVKGVVRDAAGQPVVGAAVIVKGTTRGVSSGTDGSFSFEGLADGAVLQVSALGYATAEIPVGNRSFVTVELKEDATLVDEVVVVGYGTQKKANLTGAVDQVSSELLENRPVANVTQMLQGAVPNLNISLADGKPNRVNWVFLYFPAPQCSFPDAIKLRDRFRANGQDGASFHFLEEFLTNGDIAKSLVRFGKLLLSSRAVEPQVRELFRFPGSQMDLWPVLKDNWGDSTRGWRALERCLMREAFRRYAEWAGPQEWTTFPQENCPWERMLCQSMHDGDAGPVYGAQHSTVRPTDFRYFDDPRMINDPACRRAMPELWLCNGTGAQDALLAGHMPEDRTALVEALRYLYLAPKPDAEAAPETPAKPTRLLIVTSFFADETDAHLATLAASAKAGTLDGWEVVVKPHPYLPVVERLKNLYGGAEPPSVVDGPIGNFLTPGTVVWASNSTTVALEAAFRKLPVLVQAAEDDVDLCPLQGLPGVVNVRTVSDVAAALAAPKAPDLPPDYLALDPELPRWKERLGL